MTSSPISKRLTRRQWGAGLAIAITAARANPQATSKIPPQGAPAPPKPSATPEDKMKKAAEDVRKVSDRLSQIEVPMDVEPAFAFHA